jgi:hypothetical protein
MKEFSGQHMGKTACHFLRCLVLLLVFAQFTIATHAFEHQTIQPDASCSICIQLERLGNACLPATSIAEASPNSDHDHSLTQLTRFSLVTVPYQARASP